MTEPGQNDNRLMFAFAHDLRSHLRTIRTRVELVQSGDAQLPEQDFSLLQEAVTAAGEMNGLIDAMVSYCDAGYTEGEVPLRLVLRGVLIETRALIADAGATVKIIHEPDVTVPFALHTVIGELLTNSCRFCCPGTDPEIRIESTQIKPQELEICVSDNGPGVGMEWLGRIFQPFVRLHPHTDYPGFGLGLARCRKVVEAHGGSVSAAIAAGGGLAVTLLIPVA